MSSVGQSIGVGRAFAARPARPRGWLIRRALLGADVVGLLIAFAATENIFGVVTRYQAFSTRAEIGLFLVTLPAWVLLAKLYGLYDRDESRTDHQTVDDLGGVFHLTTVGTWIVVAGVRVTGIAHPYVLRVVVFWAIAIVAIVVTRTIARRICRQHASYLQNTLVVGTGREGRLIAQRLERHPEFGLRMIGFVDSDTSATVPGLEHLRVLGTVDDLPMLVRELGVDRVIMGFPNAGHRTVLRQIRELNAHGVQVDVIPRFPELIGPEVDVHTAGGITLWSLRPFRLSRSSRALKRFGDVVLSAVGLFILAPFFLVAAIAIKVDSPGPVFFRQKRILDGRRTFRMWKFRTMVADAEQRKH